MGNIEGMILAFCSFAAYVYSIAVFGLVWLFLLPELELDVYRYIFFSPSVYSIDKPSKVRQSMITSAVIDIGLIVLFGTIHVLLTRHPVKQALRLGAKFERSFYVLQSALLLHGIMHFWLAFAPPFNPDATIWDARGSIWESILLIIFISGFITSFTGTFAIDHFELFGLSQAIDVDVSEMAGLKKKTLNSTPAEESQAMGGASVVGFHAHYKYVAHPIMAGFLIGTFHFPFVFQAFFIIRFITFLFRMLGNTAHDLIAIAVCSMQHCLHHTCAQIYQGTRSRRETRRCLQKLPLIRPCIFPSQIKRTRSRFERKKGID